MQTEIRFLVNDLITKKWNHFERLTLVDYSNNVDFNEFTAKNTLEDVLEFLLDAEQFGAPNLRQLLNTINNWRIMPAPEPIHTVVFVSKIDQKIIDSIKVLVDSLQLKNYDITFVTLGSQLNTALFKPLKTNVIPWDLANLAAPYNWDQLFEEAFGCG